MKLLLALSAMFVAAVVAAPVNSVEKSDKLVHGFQSEDELAGDITQADLSDLIDGMRRSHGSDSDASRQIERTLSILESLTPRKIRKRETTVSGNVHDSPGGASGRVDVSHKRGHTTYTGSISGGPEGANYGLGISHNNGISDWSDDEEAGHSSDASLSRGNTGWNAIFGQLQGGTRHVAEVTLGRGNADRNTDANLEPEVSSYGSDDSLSGGDTQWNANVNHGPGGISYGADISLTRGNTDWNANVNQGPGGTSYGLGVNHIRGNTELNANLNREYGETRYGLGVSHITGETDWKAAWNRGPGGTSYAAGVSKTFNNGNSRVGVDFARDAQSGNHGGFSFFHRFGGQDRRNRA